MEDLKAAQDRARRDASKICDSINAELRKHGIFLDGNAYGAIQQIVATALVAKALEGEK